jgi:methanethiol S-methyltransferase
MNMNTRSARILAYLSLILGNASMLFFAFFLFMGPLDLVRLNLTDIGALAFDACLSLLFFIQHSVMVRRPSRERFAHRYPEAYFGAAYSVASGIVLVAVLALWQGVPPVAYAAGGAWYWAVRALFVLGFALFYRASVSLKSFDPFGAKAVKRHMQKRETKRLPLSAKGAYGWVRHPLYLAMLMMIWSHPEPTLDRVLLNVLWSAWILGATLLEERDLARERGEEYERYRAKVPMIVPYKIPR